MISVEERDEGDLRTAARELALQQAVVHHRDLMQHTGIACTDADLVRTAERFEAFLLRSTP